MPIHTFIWSLHPGSGHGQPNKLSRGRRKETLCFRLFERAQKIVHHTRKGKLRERAFLKSQSEVKIPIFLSDT